jgi:hypothetical protein
MKPPLHRPRHDQPRSTEAIHQMLGAYSGERYIGMAWKPPGAGDGLAQHRRDLLVRQFLLGLLEQHRRTVAAQQHENKIGTALWTRFLT